MHGCGWDSGAARERSSALAASVASRYELGADGVGAARPGARGSRVTASRYALGAEGGGAARPGAYMCPPRNCARCLLGGVGMSKTSCAVPAAREARCKACFELLPRARVGWHTARTLLPPPPPRSSGAPVRWLMARGRRASGVAAAPRSRAAGAPATRRRRAVGGACACRARSNGRRRPCVVVVRTPTPNYLRQASPDRGKYQGSSRKASVPHLRREFETTMTAGAATATLGALSHGTEAPVP